MVLSVMVNKIRVINFLYWYSDFYQIKSSWDKKYTLWTKHNSYLMAQESDQKFKKRRKDSTLERKELHWASLHLCCFSPECTVQSAWYRTVRNQTRCHSLTGLRSQRTEVRMPEWF